MIDEQPEKTETKGPRKLIEGGVAAQAGVADAKVNQPMRFCVRETVHHRYDCHPETGREMGRLSMIEFEVTQGTPPEKWSKFQGLGMLTASTPSPPQGMGQVRREYRFNIYAESVEEAWEKFEEFNKRGAVQAEESFRSEFAAWSQQQQSRLAVVGPGAAQGLLASDGRPLGGG